MERLIFNFNGIGDKDAAAGFKAHRRLTIVGMSKRLSNKNGAVTAHTLDLNVGTDALISAKCAGVGVERSYDFLTQEFGGSETPVDIPSGSEVALDLNQTGGGTIDVTITLYVLAGQI